jgi:hypothetical protein
VPVFPFCWYCILTFSFQLNAKMKQNTSSISTKAGKVTVQGANVNTSHTINEDERREFTNHINGVCTVPLLASLEPWPPLYHIP